MGDRAPQAYRRGWCVNVVAGVPVAALAQEVSDLLPQGAFELRCSSPAEGLNDGAAEEALTGGEDAVVDAALVAPAGQPLRGSCQLLVHLSGLPGHPGQRRGATAG
jgi:hypothetical protein